MRVDVRMATNGMSLAVSKALALGYQVEPAAFALLSELTTDGQVESLLNMVIGRKGRGSVEKVILRSDL